MLVLDYDSIDDWHSSLSMTLAPVVGVTTIERVQGADPEYVEDSLELLFELAARDAVIDGVLDWISRAQLLSYHATRLTPTERDSIRADGLVPLCACDRRTRLTRALSRHPAWAGVESQLSDAIAKYGPSGHLGIREGQVHVTLSKSGVLASFDHYLQYGSEFDLHVAHHLLGDEGAALLAADGESTLITVKVPGQSALAAANPFSSLEDVREWGNVPNVAREFLQSWVHRLARPSFQSRELHTDCGLMFRQQVPADWIVSIELLNGPFGA